MTTTVQDLIDELQKLPKDARVEFGLHGGDIYFDRVFTVPTPKLTFTLGSEWVLVRESSLRKLKNRIEELECCDD